MSRYLYSNLWRGCIGAWCPSRQRFPSNIVTDYSARNNHGVLTNMAVDSDWVVSGNSVALEFDPAARQYVNCGTGITPAVLTVSLWFVSDVTDVDNRKLISSWDGADGWILERNTGNIRLYTTQNGAAVTNIISSSSPITAGVWYHVVAEAGPGRRTIYLNNTSVASDSTAGTMDYGAAVETWISSVGNSAGLSNVWDGKIDDLRIYDRWLTSAEIRLLSRRRGIAYAIAPRRRRYTATAPATNTSNLLLLGVG